MISPNCIGDKALYRSNLAAFYSKSDGFDRLSFRLTKLADHVTKKNISQLATQKTIEKILVNSLKLRKLR